jgi:hypothetical protein
VVNDRVGDPDIVLVGNAATRTVRAADQDWRVEEDALRAPDGQRLEKWTRRDAARPELQELLNKGSVGWRTPGPHQMRPASPSRSG